RPRRIMQQQQQQQQALWPRPAVSVSTAAVPAAPPAASVLTASQCYICGALSAAANVSVSFPLNKIVFRQQLHYCRFASAAKQVLVTEFGTLYRGALPPLLQRASNLGIMFGCYAIARQHLDNSRLLPTVAKDAAVARAVMAASVAGACEAALMPFERIQTLLQMGNGRHSTVSSAYGHRRATNLYRDTFHAFCELRKRYGVPELYRGLSAVLLRNTTSTALYFGLREQTRHWLPPAADSSTRSSNVCGFVQGACIGGFVSTLVYPLNVAKSHMQARVGGGYLSLSEVLSGLVAERNGRLAGLMRGSPANCFRAMLSWGVVTAAYDWLADRLFAASACGSVRLRG
ncbi:hypothetical protein BOX15_Mlig021763g2, partial [Macrostomum lignano]